MKWRRRNPNALYNCAHNLDRAADALLKAYDHTGATISQKQIASGMERMCEVHGRHVRADARGSATSGDPGARKEFRKILKQIRSLASRVRKLSG